MQINCKIIFLFFALLLSATPASAQYPSAPYDLSNPNGGAVRDDDGCVYGYATEDDCSLASEIAIANAEVLCQHSRAVGCFIAKEPNFLLPKGNGCTVVCKIECIDIVIIESRER